MIFDTAETGSVPRRARETVDPGCHDHLLHLLLRSQVRQIYFHLRIQFALTLIS